KGWRYGIEGKKSHGAGHKFESEEYYQALGPFEKEFGLAFPRFAESKSDGEKSAVSIERAYYESLMTVRRVFESQPDVVRTLGAKISARRKSMEKISATADNDGPNLAALYDADSITPLNRPANCSYKPGSKQTLRGALAHVFNDINHKTNGAILAGAADVYGSTNTLDIGAGFAGGLWHAGRNPDSRIFSAGGITEDAIGGICSGIVTIGRHLAVGASYGAFIAPLNVIAARTHAVAQQTIKQRNLDELTKTFVILCGHTGVKTGEDGPTHAEPNTLAFFQDNCPQGAVVTLTPWDAHDLWPLVVAGLKARPAVLAVYVTRPSETVFDRQSLGLAPAEDSVNGVYKLLAANGKPDATLIYQGSDVTNVFVSDVLPRLKEKGLNLDVYYIASCELFNLLAESRRAEIFPAQTSQSAMMISGFSLPTTYRWVTSERGREYTLYPHKGGAYLGSGPGEMCMKEAGLDGEAQLAAIIRFVSSS
ncbi:MAG: hypothetical protein IH914_07435, partial [candidate division Zixibacteria bacterium]|nr:hypothetical protein [candidate division Zixibacteria bacterium]